MRETRLRSASERRQEIQAAAAAMGINDAYISTLVDTFYARIREHAVIGPIFEDAIGDNWDPHLAKMKDFWASVALSAGRYSGKPVPAHQKHKQIQPWHFNIWLSLFRQTIEETVPSPEAAQYFMERAERIAESLQLAMFGVPGLPQTDETP